MLLQMFLKTKNDMIQANELRISNWIVINNGRSNPYQHQITSHDIEEIDGCGEDCFPIPLTEEILEKAGFKIGGYEDLFWFNEQKTICLSGINWADANEPDYQFVNFSWGYPVTEFTSIHFLHELQNLIYCLTKKEINYTP